MEKRIDGVNNAPRSSFAERNLILFVVVLGLYALTYAAFSVNSFMNLKKDEVQIINLNFEGSKASGALYELINTCQYAGRGGLLDSCGIIPQKVADFIATDAMVVQALKNAKPQPSARVTCRKGIGEVVFTGAVMVVGPLAGLIYDKIDHRCTITQLELSDVLGAIAL